MSTALPTSALREAHIFQVLLTWYALLSFVSENTHLPTSPLRPSLHPAIWHHSIYQQGLHVDNYIAPIITLTGIGFWFFLLIQFSPSWSDFKHCFLPHLLLALLSLLNTLVLGCWKKYYDATVATEHILRGKKIKGHKCIIASFLVFSQRYRTSKERKASKKKNTHFCIFHAPFQFCFICKRKNTLFFFYSFSSQLLSLTKEEKQFFSIQYFTSDTTWG